MIGNYMVQILYIQSHNQTQVIVYITDHIYNHIFDFSTHPVTLNLKVTKMLQKPNLYFLKNTNRYFQTILKKSSPYSTYFLKHNEIYSKTPSFSLL